MLFSRVVSIGLVAIAVSVAQAQRDSTPLTRVPAYRRRLVGIYDAQSGDPVADVRIIDVLSGVSMLTSQTGTAVLVFVPEGVRILRLQKLGYEMQTFPLSIIETDTASLTIMLKRITELPAVVTRDSAPRAIPAKLRGFEDRRNMHAGGYYITEDMLRAGDGKLLPNVLTANLPGLTLDRRSGNKAMVSKSPRCMDGTKAGPPAVYVDGIAVGEDPVEVARAARVASGTAGFGSGKASIDVQAFTVEELAAVEWYPDNSLIPADLPHDSSRCGALLLWTRVR
jgi:hypothetical protein